VARPRAADDFPTIRMCIEEFRRERAEALGVEDAGRPGQRGAGRVSPLGLVTWGGGENKKYQGLPPPLGSDDFLQVIAMGGIRLPSSRHRRIGRTRDEACALGTQLPLSPPTRRRSRPPARR
jgi:hypothetical protein